MTAQTTLKILGISGSLRQNSYNTALLRAAAELLPAGMRLEIFDLAPLPMFNPDVEKALSGGGDGVPRAAGAG